MREVQTEFGTRLLLLESGRVSLQVEKRENELVWVTVQLESGNKTCFSLAQKDLLTLIEWFAVAAREGTGRPIIDVEVPALEPG